MSDKINEFFNYSEFDSPDVIGSGRKMEKSFLDKLTKARVIADISFIILSGCRTWQHNKQVGGVEDSSHLIGCAADIKATTSIVRWKIVSALLLAGFTRIGIGHTFIHVDDDESKTQNVIWLY